MGQCQLSQFALIAGDEAITTLEPEHVLSHAGGVHRGTASMASFAVFATTPDVVVDVVFTRAGRQPQQQPVEPLEPPLEAANGIDVPHPGKIP